MIARISTVLIFVFCLCATCWSEPTSGVRALEKKLIEYGWDVPFPDFIRANIRKMEERPFDGLIFKLHGGGRALTPTAWEEAKFVKDYEDVQNIKWEKFTDNFIIIWAASKQDWFNDEHWKAIENNVRLVAKAARLAGCVGVCFDPEPYGGNPWLYTQAARRGAKSFAEYEAIARRRGAQFIKAIESELPKPKILTFFQLSLFSSFLVPMKPEDRAAKLSQHHYGLLPAFLNGMLDAAGPNVTIIDGNEGAYYYTESRQHFEVYHRIAQRGLLLIDPRLWPKYRAHVQVGQALYIDQYFGLRTRKVLGHYMTPEERPKWFEHNCYWAMYTADKYVWCYSERMNWWTNRDVPPGCEEAIRAARSKLAKGQPLGIDLKAIVDDARSRQRAEIKSRLKQRVAKIAPLPTGAPRPKIDGALDDGAWRETKPLTPFVALASLPQKLAAETQAYVTYDDRALFIALRCNEPKPQKMHIIGERRDDDLWQGDDVEILISAPGKTTPFYHFMLNPHGIYWDSINSGSDDRSYNPHWERAAHISSTSWTAEIAIPWVALKMERPQRGAKLSANLCRQRTQGRELSAWSPMAQGFLEADLFGAWVFQ